MPVHTKKAKNEVVKAEARRGGSRHHPEQTRQAILDAAFDEFAEHGITGARTDEIARNAGVNKALLYYYFEDKETLYGAVIDRAFSGLHSATTQALATEAGPRERLLAYVAAHYDYIARVPKYPRLVQREMMRSGRNVSPHMQLMAQKYFTPLMRELEKVFRQGVASGEFRNLDPGHAILSVIGLIVFYFSSASWTTLTTSVDPLSPEQIAAHREFVLDFVSTAVFKR